MTDLSQAIIKAFLSDQNVHNNTSQGFGTRENMEYFVRTTGMSLVRTTDFTKGLKELNTWYQAEFTQKKYRPGSPNYKGTETERILNVFYNEKKPVSPPWSLNSNRKKMSLDVYSNWDTVLKNTPNVDRFLSLTSRSKSDGSCGSP